MTRFIKKCNSPEILNPLVREYREQLYEQMSRLCTRYGALDRKDKIFVTRMILHKLEENKL